MMMQGARRADGQMARWPDVQVSRSSVMTTLSIFVTSQVVSWESKSRYMYGGTEE